MSKEEEMSLDKKSLFDMPFDEMSLDELSFDEMSPMFRAVVTTNCQPDLLKRLGHLNDSQASEHLPRN